MKISNIKKRAEILLIFILLISISSFSATADEHQTEDYECGEWLGALRKCDKNRVTEPCKELDGSYRQRSRYICTYGCEVINGIAQCLPKPEEPIIAPTPPQPKTGELFTPSGAECGKWNGQDYCCLEGGTAVCDICASRGNRFVKYYCRDDCNADTNRCTGVEPFCKDNSATPRAGGIFSVRYFKGTCFDLLVDSGTASPSELTLWDNVGRNLLPEEIRPGVDFDLLTQRDHTTPFKLRFSRNWNSQNPDNVERAGNSQYSISYSAYYNFIEGQYWFYVKSDDRIMIYVDDKLVAEHIRSIHSADNSKSGLVNLEGGRHRIDVQYINGNSPGEVQFGWDYAGRYIPPDIPSEPALPETIECKPQFPIPGSDGWFNVQYYSGACFDYQQESDRRMPSNINKWGNEITEAKKLIFTEEWGADQLYSKGKTKFSAAFSSKYRLEPGTYEFFTESDDGSILWLDGELIVNNDGDHDKLKKTATKTIGQEKDVLVEVQYYNNDPGGYLSFGWEKEEPEEGVSAPPSDTTGHAPEPGDGAPENQLPVVTPSPIGRQEAIAGEIFILDVTAYDPDGDELEYRFKGFWIWSKQKPKGMIMTRTNTGFQLRWTPKEEDIGKKHKVGLQIKDRHGHILDKTFTISVIEADFEQVTRGTKPALRTATTKPSDFDSDSYVTFDDFALFKANFGKTQQDSDFDSRYDLNKNGAVDFPDFLEFAEQFEKEKDNLPETLG